MTDFKAGVERIKALEDSKKTLQAQAQKNYSQANQTKAIIDAVTTSAMVLLSFARDNVAKVEITNPTAPMDLTELSTKLDVLIEEEIKASADSAMLDVLIDIKNLLTQSAEPVPESEDPEEVIVKNIIDYSECLGRIEELLGREQPNPVYSPNIEVHPTEVVFDFKEIKEDLANLSAAFGSFTVDIPPNDFSELVEATNTVKEAVASIVIPKPPNFTSTYQDPSGASARAIINAESRFDTTSEAGSVFLGKTAPGTPESTEAWQIKKIDITAGSSVFADNETTFTKAWADRLSYNY